MWVGQLSHVVSISYNLGFKNLLLGGCKRRLQPFCRFSTPKVGRLLSGAPIIPFVRGQTAAGLTASERSGGQGSLVAMMRDCTILEIAVENRETKGYNNAVGRSISGRERGRDLLPPRSCIGHLGASQANPWQRDGRQPCRVGSDHRS